MDRHQFGRRVGAAAVAAVLAASVVSQGAAQSSLRTRMLQAENARGHTVAPAGEAPAGEAPAGNGLAALDEGLRSGDPALRRQAVRAFGRLERPDLISRAFRAADDSDPGVQQAAIDAIGQMATTPASVAEAQADLLVLEPRVGATAWAVLAATLGRLPYDDGASVRRVERLLARVLPGGPDRSRGVAGLVGAARGLEALFRQSRKLSTPESATLAGLRRLAVLHDAAGNATRVVTARRLAWTALVTADAADIDTIRAGLRDTDDEVRRLAAAAAGGDAAGDGRRALLETALADAGPRVRYEALRAWGRRLQSSSCAPLTRALADPDPHVRLLAIDMAGDGCPEGESPAAVLERTARRTLAPAVWHEPAHALVSLAHVAPAAAQTLLPRFVESAIWQVRTYAARAAGVIGDRAVLTHLAGDASDNVRSAAVTALAEGGAPEAVPAAIAALARPDYQLAITAAGALAKAGPANGPAAVAALLDALDRISAERRDTARDARIAILDRLETLGDASSRARLDGYVSDPDPVVARRAAEVLTSWTGTVRVPDPHVLPIPPLDAAALASLGETRLAVTIAGKGTFILRLHTDEAPLTCLRVVTLARKGYYDGLTFHRVVPNFVIQGGSPGANEYMGDGPFMRDEVGLTSHTRGTVGISTRGRDTGDAQWFVNLVDSPRLDHVYTVFADVTDGMAVVDSVLEGDVIETVEVL